MTMASRKCDGERAVAPSSTTWLATVLGRIEALGDHALQVTVSGDGDQVFIDRKRARCLPGGPVQPERVEPRATLAVALS